MSRNRERESERVREIERKRKNIFSGKIYIRIIVLYRDGRTSDEQEVSAKIHGNQQF